MKNRKHNVIMMVTLVILCGWSSVALGQTVFNDDFNGTTLHTNWTVTNPNAPSSVGLTGNGELKMVASTANGGSDYWPSINFNAPRMLTPVSGDWDLMVKMRFNPTRHFEGAGILIMPDTVASSTKGVRLFEQSFEQTNGHTILNCGKYTPYTDSLVYIHIKKIDTFFIGTFSPDSMSWSNPDTTFLADDIHFIGLHTIRKTYSADMTDGTSYFDFFHLTTNQNVAVKNITRSFDFQLYPNPTRDVLAISNFPAGSNLSVRDVSGKIVVAAHHIRETEISLSTANLVNGIYFLQLENDGRTANKKFVISK